MQSCPTAWRKQFKRREAVSSRTAGTCTGAVATLTRWNGREHGDRWAKTFLSKHRSFPRARGVRQGPRAHSTLEMKLRDLTTPLTVRTDCIPECEDTCMEEETEARREDRGWVLGLVSLRLLSSGLSWKQLGAGGLTVGSGPSAVPKAVPTHPPELCLPSCQLEIMGGGEDVCRPGKGALDWDVGLQTPQSWGPGRRPQLHLRGGSLLAGNLLLPGRDQVIEGDAGDAGSGKGVGGQTSGLSWPSRWSYLPGLARGARVSQGGVGWPHCRGQARGP